MITTAATLRDRVLHPALDARAENTRQQSLIANATPEADCFLDYLHLLRAPASSHQRSEQLLHLARLARELAESNQAEGQAERQIAGAADSLVRAARDVELNGGGEAVLASKGIARALREPLRTLLAATRVGYDELQALRAVDRVVAQAPRLQVLSHTVARELGAGKFGLLVELVGPETQDAGAGSSRPASKTLGSGEGHGAI